MAGLTGNHQVTQTICTLFSICLFVVVNQAHALEESGEEILDTCLSERQALAGNPVKSVRYGLCLGYLKGIADTLNGKFFCLPETGETAAITQRLKQIFIDYAMQHKMQLKNPASRTILPAFQQAFPCQIK